jgi:hypothetical protein
MKLPGRDGSLVPPETLARQRFTADARWCRHRNDIANPKKGNTAMNNVDFASFDVSELSVLDVTDAVALPDMGASVIVVIPFAPDGDEVLGEQDLGWSGSLSTSCC